MRSFGVEFWQDVRYFARMFVPFDTFTSDGRVVISFPEAAVPPQQREEFITFLKAEWAARQSFLKESGAKALADEVDAGWWDQNRKNILRRIGEE